MMGFARGLGLSLALVLFTLATVARAEAVGGAALDLSEAVNGVSLVGRAAILEDPPGTLRVEDVERAAARFARGSGEQPTNHGYSSSAFWLRLDLRQSEPGPVPWVIVLKNPLVDVFELYRRRDDGTYSVIRTGARMAVSERPFQHRYPTLPLGGVSAQPETVYLRLQTSDVAVFPLELMSEREFVRRDHDDQLVLGIYFGVLFIAIVFNLFVFAYLRDKTYREYALFLASYGLFQASFNGLAFEYLWPSSVAINTRAISTFCGLTAFFGVGFARKFLHAKRLAPRVYSLTRWLRGAALALVGMGVAGMTKPAGVVGSALAVLTMLAVVGMGIVALSLRYRPASYFMLAGGALLLGVLLNALRNFGLLPSTLLTAYGNQFASIFVVTVFSLALLARFNVLRVEKEEAHAQLLRSQQAVIEQLRRSARLKLEALQAEINPHFLYNSLNAVTGLIPEDPERADGLVRRLASLFRYTLDATQRERVSLGEELAIVRSYLEIEQIRFGERLRYEVETSGDIERVRLPGLTIQPLVENSVRHGLRDKIEGGRVSVRAEVAGGRCRIVVHDDGVGFDPQARRGHGLANVRERLRLAYGGTFEMAICGVAGTRVDIVLPLEDGGDSP